MEKDTWRNIYGETHVVNRETHVEKHAWINKCGETHVENHTWRTVRVTSKRVHMILIFSGNVARGYQYWEGKIYPIPVDADK